MDIIFGNQQNQWRSLFDPRKVPRIPFRSRDREAQTLFSHLGIYTQIASASLAQRNFSGTPSSVRIYLGHPYIVGISNLDALNNDDDDDKEKHHFSSTLTNYRILEPIFLSNNERRRRLYAACSRPRRPFGTSEETYP